MAVAKSELAYPDLTASATWKSLRREGIEPTITRTDVFGGSASSHSLRRAPEIQVFITDMEPWAVTLEEGKKMALARAEASHVPPTAPETVLLEN